MTVALQIDGLYKRFGDHQVLNGFSLQVARGEVVAAVGHDVVSPRCSTSFANCCKPMRGRYN